MNKTNIKAVMIVLLHLRFGKPLNIESDKKNLSSKGHQLTN